MDGLRRWLVLGPFAFGGHHGFMSLLKSQGLEGYTPGCVSSLDGTRASGKCHFAACELQYPKLMKTPTVRRRGWKPGSCRKALGAGFLNLDATDVAGWAVLCPVHCRLFGTSGLSP